MICLRSVLSESTSAVSFSDSYSTCDIITAVGFPLTVITNSCKSLPALSTRSVNLSLALVIGKIVVIISRLYTILYRLSMKRLCVLISLISCALFLTLQISELFDLIYIFLEYFLTTYFGFFCF